MAELSLLGFAMKLTEMTVAVHEEGKSALEAAAVLVQKEAVSSLGAYQSAAPPFAAWAELTDSTKEDRLRQGFTENDPEYRTGAMGQTIQHTVEMRDADGTAYVGSDDQILEWQELGTVKMPPRSILGSALIRKETEVRDLIGGYVYGALVGNEVHQGEIGLIE